MDYLALIAQQHRTQIADQINYRGMLLPTTEDAQPQPEPDHELEAELASFALLGNRSANGSVSTELPGQLDLTDLTDLTAFSSSEGQR